MIEEVGHTLTAEEIRDLVGTSPVMLEIGCHDGSDTVKFLEAMPGIELHCFEPDERPLKRFRKRFAKYDRRLCLIPKAVSNIDGHKPFWASTGKAGHMEDWDYSGSLRTPTGHLARSPEIKFKEPVPVPCVRLETWWRERSWLDLIDFAWIDVQGDQRALIDGGWEVLQKTHWIYIECHHEPLYESEPTQDELIALLPGFEPLAIYDRDNILFRNRHFP